MDTNRKKQINLDAIFKAQKFLEICQEKIEKGEYFSPEKLARSLNTSAMIAKHAIELDVIRKGDIKGEYSLGDKFSVSRITAKMIIEARRLHELGLKQKKEDYRIEGLKNKLISDHTINPNTKANEEHLPEFKSNLAKEIGQILNKSINVQPNMFSDQEKEFDDKLKIACAIASGQYSLELDNYGAINDWILEATNDLYSKLKNNK